MDYSKFLSAKDVMEVLDISYPSLLRMVKKNQIPVIRVGRSLRFPQKYFNELESQAMLCVKENR